MSDSNRVEFTLSGLTPDTSLKVFHTEFVVHSMCLKTHSSFFRTFLDSSDKIPAPTYARFKYEYVTVVDGDDKGWGLELASKAMKNAWSEETSPVADQASKKDYYSAQVACFTLLLSAIYGRAYTVPCVDSLETLTCLADYYGALQIVSNTLDSALARSHNLVDQIPSHPLRLLHAARTLRHSILFRDALVFVVGDWKKYKKEIRHPENRPLLSSVLMAYAKVGEILEDTSSNLHRAIRDSLSRPILKFLNSQHGYIAISRFPFYYRELYDEDFTEFTIKKSERLAAKKLMKCWLEPLMKNNLVLDRSGDGVGEGIHSDRFLCASIDDDDLPWDPKQTDW